MPVEDEVGKEDKEEEPEQQEEHEGRDGGGRGGCFPLRASVRIISTNDTRAHRTPNLAVREGEKGDSDRATRWKSFFLGSSQGLHKRQN